MLRLRELTKRKSAAAQRRSLQGLTHHSMPAFQFDRRRLCRTVWATLVVWLFALAAGVVNACVLTPAGPAEHDTDAVTAARHGSRLDPGEPVAHLGYGQDAGKTSCLKFCDDESSAIAKVKLPVVDLESSLLTVLKPWNATAATGSVEFRPSLEQPGSQGPPLVIRFLRLTL